MKMNQLRIFAREMQWSNKGMMSKIFIHMIPDDATKEHILEVIDTYEKSLMHCDTVYNTNNHTPEVAADLYTLRMMVKRA